MTPSGDWFASEGSEGDVDDVLLLAPSRDSSGQGGSVSASGVQSIDGLMSGYRWTSTNLTLAFATLASDYGAYAHTSGTYGSVDETLTFSPATAQAQGAAREAVRMVAQFANLTFTETATIAGADIRVAESSGLPAVGGTSGGAAYAYYPTGFFKGGDVWLGPSTGYDTPLLGTWGYRSIWHEIGHALGLKHAHATGGVSDVATPAARNGHEFTVMTYYSYIGGPSGYPNEYGGHPQSWMMDDIRALQQMYGANFTSAASNPANTVYTFSPTTGQMFVAEAGGAAVGEVAPPVNRIFRTLWDGGGTDTYDLSNYTTNMTISLVPGEWSTFSSAQLSNLGSGNYARGNLANALQYNSDLRSLIENAIGGTGNDSISGNSIANTLTGGGGDDTLTGALGDDTLDGGAGSDQLLAGDGNDLVIWDAGDQLAFVDGGAGSDVLRVVNAAAPTTFDLAAHGFESANVYTTDSGGNWWSATSDYHNTSWQLTNRDWFADDGRLLSTTYDVSAGGTGIWWQYVTDYYSAPDGLGVRTLTNQDGLKDDGGAFAKAFDTAQAANGVGADGVPDWLVSYTNFFRSVGDQAAGLALNVEGIADDGRKFTQTNDLDSAYAWIFQTDWFKVDGVTLDYKEIRWDDGSTQIIPY